MSFINREKLLNEIHKAGGTGAEPETWAKGWDDGITHAILIVQQRPEVPIIRRAKARKVVDQTRLGSLAYKIFKCGICGNLITSPGFYKFCPYCGAKLEG